MEYKRMAMAYPLRGMMVVGRLASGLVMVMLNAKLEACNRQIEC